MRSPSLQTKSPRLLYWFIPQNMQKTLFQCHMYDQTDNHYEINNEFIVFKDPLQHTMYTREQQRKTHEEKKGEKDRFAHYMLYGKFQSKLNFSLSQQHVRMHNVPSINSLFSSFFSSDYSSLIWSHYNLNHARLLVLFSLFFFFGYAW